mgnify:CR=1 FL=1
MRDLVRMRIIAEKEFGDPLRDIEAGLPIVKVGAEGLPCHEDKAQRERRAPGAVKVHCGRPDFRTRRSQSIAVSAMKSISS